MAEQKGSQDLVQQIKKTLNALEVFQRTIATEKHIPISQLGEVLREERKKQKVTRDMLSRLSGVSIGTINAIETGKTTPSLVNIQKVLQALGKNLWIK
jgi:DNA-binding XRE family transcriptional regulator